MTSSKPSHPLFADYADWLSQLKRGIAQGWGAKVIDRLAHDLKDAFPDMRGWSPSNLKYMRFFAQHCPDGQFGQQGARPPISWRLQKRCIGAGND